MASKSKEPFYAVMRNPDLRRLIQSNQRGVLYKDWTDGDKAARLGYVELLKSKAAEGVEMKFSTAAMNDAALFGHYDTVKWLLYSKKPCTDKAMDLAAKNGHLDIVKLLHSNGKQCTTDAIYGAAFYGHLDVVKWLYEKYPNESNNLAMEFAAMNGHNAVVEWFHKNGV
jgi:hypothetical protein